jgi:hypothetical protein
MQISLTTEEIFEESGALAGKTRLVKGVLANETDPYFLWQFDGSYVCPKGCAREEEGGCAPSEEKEERKTEL